MISRRQFLVAGAGAGSCLAASATTPAAPAPAAVSELVIDIHQHTNYSGRPNARLLAHQRAMGITHTILLPAGSPISTASTHQGRSLGLAAQCGGNASVAEFASQHPGEFSFGANEIPDLPDAPREIESWLKRGARIIAEQKFAVPADGPDIIRIATLAREYGVPVLLHFQIGEYNLGFENFHRVLERFPTVAFIGHAQTWWASVDEYHQGQPLYPTHPVTPGGLTDRYLSDYPNMYGDLSAGSGLNFLLRDEAHARWFLVKHQDRLLYGSDCNDLLGRGPGCQGAQTLATVRRLVPNPAVRRKLLFENARRLFKLDLPSATA